MDEAVYQIVVELNNRKKENRIHPEHVCMMELNMEIRQSLNRLYSAKRIEVGTTFNDKFIKPTS